MDTRRQQVYGRRRRKNAQDLQLFADLLESSPAKASIQLTQQDEGFHENHERLVENLQSENSNSTIDIVAQQMKSLALGRVITAPQEQTKAASQVLKDRSVNSQTLVANEESKKPRIRRSRAPGVTKPIVEVKEPVALVHNELETLAVVLEDLHLPHLPGETNATAVTEESDPSKERQEAPILRSSRKTGKQSIVAKPKPLPLELIEYAKPLLSLCSDTFNSSAPSGFQDWSDSLARYFDIIKIAEASYGEVYRLSLRTSKAGFGKGDESVLKLIALKPPPALRPMSGMTAAQKGKVANMSEMVDVASEVRLLQRMSPVPGFTNFRDVRVMRGRLPTHFVTAWRHFHKNVKKSCFPDPGRKTTHDEDQLWAVVEMQDAGKDLETVPVESEAMCWDAFWGVAIALAKGEEWAEFEVCRCVLMDGKLLTFCSIVICTWGTSASDGRPHLAKVKPNSRQSDSRNSAQAVSRLRSSTILCPALGCLYRRLDPVRGIPLLNPTKARKRHTSTSPKILQSSKETHRRSINTIYTAPCAPLYSSTTLPRPLSNHRSSPRAGRRRPAKPSLN